MRNQVQITNKGLFYKPESSQTIQSSYASNQEFQRNSCPWAGVGRVRESLGSNTWTAGRNRVERRGRVSSKRVVVYREERVPGHTGTGRDGRRHDDGTKTVGIKSWGRNAWETAMNHPVQSNKQDWVWLGFMPGNMGCAWLSAGDSNLQVRRTRGRVIDNILWLIEND